MWIVYRSKDDKAETLMLDTHQFRKIGGMPYPFESEIDADKEVRKFSKTEPDWEYEVRWFGR